MLVYILKRILFFIPTIFIISLFTFALSVNSPGDPVEMLMKSSSDDGQASNKSAKREEYDKLRKKLNLDLPVFYFSMANLAEPDTLYKLPKKLHRENLSRLIDQYGDWTYIQEYYAQLSTFNDYLSAQNVSDSLQDVYIEIKQTSSELFYKYKHEEIAALTGQMGIDLNLLYTQLPVAKEKFSSLLQSYENVRTNAEEWKTYFPVVHIYGFNNQYHRWLLGLFVGDFGTSYYTKQPVMDMIADRIAPTVLFSFLSIFIAFAVSIPLGLTSAVQKGTRRDSIVTVILFVLYSLPSFWIATLLINYLTNPEYLDWFPTLGLKDFDEDAGFWEKVGNYAHHMILPLFCYTYVSFAFISRQMRGSMLQTLQQDYIRTAWAKGLSPRTVYWKHALRNSLLPIITMLASIFPSLIAGSVVIECLFTLPGMGKLAYEAEVIKDYPVIFTIMLFSAVLTLVGYLVADILYAVADPRISYNKK